MGYIWKALEKGYLEPFRTVHVLLAASFYQQAAAMSSYIFTPRAVASPDSPRKPLTRKRAHSGGAEWVQVTRHEPGSRAKKPREAIPWRKVGLLKQRNVDLTTDGLWAMPLNEGWVPLKARRLQDWQKLKKYVPVHKQGDACPNGVPALPEKRNADDDSDSQ